MKERLIRQLPAEVRQALQLAQRLTGRAPVLKWVDSLPHETRAMLVRPTIANRPYEIHVVKGEERVLPHLIVHEVGHLVRLHQVPEEERLIAAVTPEARRRAFAQLEPELEGLVRRGLPAAVLREVVDVWQHSLATQLANFPADLRIEAWINARFPRLLGVQWRALSSEVERSFPLFDPRVIALTPPTVYRATMEMNAAQAVQVAELFRRPDLVVPFAQHGLEEPGRRLVELALSPADEGHRSDMAATNVWAEALGVTGWFEWRPFQASL